MTTMTKSKATGHGANLQLAMSRIGLRDVLINQGTADIFLANMTRFAETATADAEALEVASREALELAYGYEGTDREDRKPFVYQDGMAIIPIHGTLINRFNSCWGFVTGYNYIRRMLNAALDDDDVTMIIFDVDSPGGEAAGCFELAREIMASRRVKPSLAMVDSLAASGGIALPVCATKMYAIPSARIGSIGVYRMHISYEGALKNEGIKVTFATAGEHKVDGNMYQDLPDEVLKDWQQSAGKTWDDFISLVAEARDMDEDAVRNTQARIYRADEALALGLIDAVQTSTEAVSAFAAELGDDYPSNDEEDDEMSEKPKGSEVTSVLTAADKADIARIAAEAAGAVVGKVMGDVQRQQSIKDYAASKGKAFVSLGATLAGNENMSLEDAKAIIDAAAPAVASAPKAKKAKAARIAAEDEDGEDDDSDDADDDADDSDDADDDDDAGEAAAAPKQGKKAKADKVNHFDRAMANSDHPNVGAGSRKGGKKGGEMSDDEVGASILADAALGGASWAKPSKTAH